MSVNPAVLEASLKRLNSITHQAYNHNIRQVALDTWQRHLSPKNPQWEFITSKSFSVADNSGSAHIMAMVDQRLPSIGIVGYFACTNSHVGSKALQQACQWLRTNSKLSAIYGPINGTLPSDYRLNLDDDYAFPGEPVNPKWHIDAFEKAGFKVFNRYASGRLRHFRLVLKFIAKKPAKDLLGIAVRPFSSAHYDKDFKTYHDLRNLIFPFQSLYCPAISLAERIYNSPSKFDANYTYFLTHNSHEVGFIMAYRHRKQLIVKTIGILPQYRGKGLSGMLLRPVHEQAAQDGLTTAIYGMVRVGNPVYSSRHPLARVFRKYVTMYKKL